jgi:hypothetical protein
MRDQNPRNTSSFRVKKNQGKRFFPEPPEGMQPCQSILDLFDLQNYKRTNLCVF